MIQKRNHGTVRRQNNRYKQSGLTLFIALCIWLLLPGGSGVAGAANGYIGLGVGVAWSTFDTSGVRFHAEDISANNTVWRMFGGYRLNDYIGV